MTSAAQQVTELKRSDAEIVRALQYAREQLSTTAELNMVERTGRQILERLLHLLASIGVGQTDALVMKSVDELLEELKRDPRPASVIPEVIIGAALERRAAARARVRAKEEELSNEIARLTDRWTALDNMLKYDVGDASANRKERQGVEKKRSELELEMGRLVAASSVDYSDSELLRQYRSATRLIENGLPSGILEWDLGAALK